MADFTNAVAGTNAIAAPNDFGSVWADSYSTVTITPDNDTGPTGDGTADLIAFNTGSLGYHAFRYTLNATTKSYYRYQVYVKAKSWTWVRCAIYDKSDTARYFWVNIATGQLGTVNSPVINASVTPSANGYYLISADMYVGSGSGSSNGVQLMLCSADNHDSLFSGTIGSGMWAWGASFTRLSNITYTLGASGADYTTLPNLVAAITLQPGDVVDGRSETYRASASWTAADSGSDSKQITIKNLSLLGSKALAAGSGGWTNDSGGQYHRAEADTVCGLVIVSGDAVTGTKTKLVRAVDLAHLGANQFYRESGNLYVNFGGTDPDTVTFEECFIGGHATIDSINSTRLLLVSGSYWTLENITLLYSGGKGVEILNATGTQLIGGNYSYCADDNIHGTGTNPATVIRGQSISSPLITSWSGQDLPALSGFGDGISFHDTPTVEIYWVTATRNFKAGIANAGGTTTHHCLISYNKYAFTTSGTQTAYHNIILIENSVGNQMGVYSQIGFVGTFNFWNNLIICTDATASTACFGVYIDGNGSESGTVNAKNNIFTKVGYGFYKVGSFSGTLTEEHNDVFGSLTPYQGCSAGTGSISADPKFVSSTDYHLQSSSPCINAGVDVGLTSDYEGNAVPVGATPDIGIYENAFGTLTVDDLQQIAMVL